ncbi:MAG: UDP-N-acetylmuramoyl-L-alanyl-D-glutamate--2,6-diaminopimelate ligase [Actinomycetaceae bacterium]|nr:UDP-N-acetylmuramoyl-L-alanyl-D-glutamate--2,6-diaminopimelate ligase [Actinomycetaceae bacterium]
MDVKISKVPGDQPARSDCSAAQVPMSLTDVPSVSLAQVADILGSDSIYRGTQAIEQVHFRGAVGDNRKVRASNLFLAMPGAHVHGMAFASQALKSGAACLATTPSGWEQYGETLPEETPVVISENLPKRAGEISALAWGHPFRRLRNFGVTGTNGKTTTTFMISHILRALGHKTGLMGTVCVDIDGHAQPAELTTPQPWDVQGIGALMVDRGIQDCVMEVSSHALTLGRVRPLVFDVAAFSNLTQDHLDFHSDMEDYFLAKAKLFKAENSRTQVVLIDNPWGLRLAKELGNFPHVHTLSLTGGQARWQGQFNVEKDSAEGGATLTLKQSDNPAEELRVYIGLPGVFNVENAALALVSVLAAGHTIPEISQALGPRFMPEIPGRMELVGSAPRVVVDFAHNPDGLEQALSSLQKITEGKLIVVFGATGERDRDKRPKMARIVAAYADAVFVTDDDPHEEDPAQIRAEVMAGFDNEPEGYAINVDDRAKAIDWAIKLAKAQDTVLVAGRGHESHQALGRAMIEMDDRVLCREALRRHHGGGAQ